MIAMITTHGPGLHTVIAHRVSDELWDKSVGMLNADPMRYNRGYKDCIIHLIDSVSRGYTTPLEAYEALSADYFPAGLIVRRSAYEYLVTP